MTPSSAKAKGRRLQQDVALALVAASSPELEPRDCQSTSMGAGGVDVKLSAAAFSQYPFSIECKNVAAFTGYRYWDQAAEHTEDGIPLVVVKANLRDPLVMLTLEDFLDILSAAKLAVDEPLSAWALHNSERS